MDLTKEFIAITFLRDPKEGFNLGDSSYTCVNNINDRFSSCAIVLYVILFFPKETYQWVEDKYNIGVAHTQGIL